MYWLSNCCHTITNYLLIFPAMTSTMDSSLLSNIQKLFYERIEVFGTVNFSKLSIVTGIIKIVLKVCGRSCPRGFWCISICVPSTSHV